MLHVVKGFVGQGFNSQNYTFLQIFSYLISILIAFFNQAIHQYSLSVGSQGFFVHQQLEQGVMIAWRFNLSLGIEVINWELQVRTACPFVLVKEEHHVARQHQDKMRTTFFGHQENLGDGLIDDGRRKVIFLFVQVLSRNHICPLSCIIALLTGILIRLTLVLLLKESGRWLLIHRNQMLHFHNEHTNLVATSQDVTYRNHFDDFTIVADHIRLLIGMVRVIAQNL